MDADERKQGEQAKARTRYRKYSGFSI